MREQIRAFLEVVVKVLDCPFYFLGVEVECKKYPDGCLDCMTDHIVKAVVEWGEEPCNDHADCARRECTECWQSLKEGE